MNAALHAWVRRWWAGEAGSVGRALSALTAPLEAAYRVGQARHRRRWDARGGERVDGLTVISVGNLAVGGTGKTPIAAWVARAVADAGVPTALVARGYGEDELALHRRWNPDVAVHTGADRVAAARAARAAGARAAVLDDGFQHRRLARALDIVLVAAEAPLPGRLLPRGPFREPARSLRRAGLVVVTRRVAPATEADRVRAHVHAESARPVAVAHLAAGAWSSLAGDAVPTPSAAVLVATGVARPETVAAQVRRAAGVEVELMAFPDHHAFSESDARRIRKAAGSRSVVVTEKDAVKLAALAASLPQVVVLGSEVRFEAGEPELRALLDATVAEADR